jgi:hypothetical protein
MSRCPLPHASKGKKPHGRRLPSEPSPGTTRRWQFGELLDRRDVRTLRGRLTSYLADPSGSGSPVRSGASRSTTRGRSPSAQSPRTCGRPSLREEDGPRTRRHGSGVTS